MHSQIVTAAKKWIGTPYHHGASYRGVGCDCLGLIRGIWRDVLGDEPCQLTPYPNDWAERGCQYSLVDGLAQYFDQVEIKNKKCGDILVLRFGFNTAPKHLAILSQMDPITIIHAYSGHGVVENSFDRAWQRGLCAVFRFPLGKE